MKNRRILALCLCMAAMPVASMAQTNIINAFAKFKSEAAANITESHEIQRDPQSGKKTSQCDLCEFSIPKGKKSLIDNVLRAFRQDSGLSYSLSSGKRTKNNQPVGLAQGGGEKSGVVIAKDMGAEYIYACFLDKEDTTGIYRYAYAMDWREEGGSLVGMLVVTYATTMKYRQEQQAMSKAAGLNMLKSPKRDPQWLRHFEYQTTLLSHCISTNQDNRHKYACNLYELAKSGLYDDDDRALALTMLSDILPKARDAKTKALINATIDALK